MFYILGLTKVLLQLQILRSTYVLWDKFYQKCINIYSSWTKYWNMQKEKKTPIRTY